MDNNDKTSAAADAAGTRPREGAEGAILTCGALAWLGLSISILLVRHHADAPSLFCPVRGGCDAVLTSKYASMLGVPLPWLGVGFYSLLLLLALGAYGVSSAGARTRLMGAALWVSVMGASGSAVLMFIQFGLLHAFCPLCTASAVVAFALAVASGFAEGRACDPTFSGRRGGALALALFAIIPTSAQLLPRAVEDKDVVAVVDGQKFTRQQMEEELGAPLQTLRQSIYAREFEWVREKVDGVLLAAAAAKTKTDTHAALAARIAAVREASPEEITARLSNNGLPETPENIADAKAELLAEAKEQARVAYMEELALGHDIAVMLEPPKNRVLQIDLTTAKISGPRDAKVQLVVFSDFQCDFCRKLSPVLKRVRAEFPNDVMLAYRYFPVESHPRAIPAAVAAECAAEQGLFWEYHDRLYGANGDLGDDHLAAIAKEVGVDQEKFRECRASSRARSTVESSRDDAIANGLEGAPALFLNGKMIGGMIDYEPLAARINDALRDAAAALNESSKKAE
jgi:protein-disulfide isomerase/uncharacterized membrane protein